MKLYRDDKSGRRTWAQLAHVFDFSLMAVLAVLAAHPCWAAGNRTDDSTSSGTTKVAAQAGTLRFVDYRSPAGVSARILDGDQPVFQGIGKDTALLFIQPTGRAAVAPGSSSGRMDSCP